MPPRQILVRCSVQNRFSEASVRFVAADEFGLWQYAMANRHGITVQQASVGLWVQEEEFERHRARYERSVADPTLGSHHEPVDRLDISLFDDDLGLCHLVRRFAPSLESQRLMQRLCRQLGQQRPERELHNGQFVASRQVRDLSRLSQPLSSLSLEMSLR